MSPCKASIIVKEKGGGAIAIVIIISRLIASKVPFSPSLALGCLQVCRCAAKIPRSAYELPL